MSDLVLTKTYDPPIVYKKDILRYMGSKEDDKTAVELIDQAMAELDGKLCFKVCYTELPVSVRDGVCDFELFKLYSYDLAKNLSGCSKAVIFGATIGIEIDRLIARYGRISPSRALVLDAIGSERIEALCDAFCNDIGGKKNIRPRFSPGYGDLSLETQKDIFSLLDCQRRIGLFLGNSLLMSPSKSVSAIIGIPE